MLFVTPIPAPSSLSFSLLYTPLFPFISSLSSYLLPLPQSPPSFPLFFTLHLYPPIAPLLPPLIILPLPISHLFSSPTPSLLPLPFSTYYIFSIPPSLIFKSERKHEKVKRNFLIANFELSLMLELSLIWIYEVVKICEQNNDI